MNDLDVHELLHQLYASANQQVVSMSASRGTGKSMFGMLDIETFGHHVAERYSNYELIAEWKFGVRRLTERELKIAVPLANDSFLSAPNSYPRLHVDYMLKVGVLREHGKDKDAPKYEDRIFVAMGPKLQECVRVLDVMEDI